MSNRKYMRRNVPILVGSMILGSCMSHSPHQKGSTGNSTTSALPNQEPKGCQRARTLRENAKKFSKQGKLIRASRLLEQSERLCSEQRMVIWEQLFPLWEELGRTEEILKKIKTIPFEQLPSRFIPLVERFEKIRLYPHQYQRMEVAESAEEMLQLYEDVVVHQTHSWGRKTRDFLEAIEKNRHPYSRTMAGFLAMQSPNSSQKPAQVYFDQALDTTERFQQQIAFPRLKAETANQTKFYVNWQPDKKLVELKNSSFKKRKVQRIFSWPNLVELGSEWLAWNSIPPLIDRDEWELPSPCTDWKGEEPKLEPHKVTLPPGCPKYLAWQQASQTSPGAEKVNWVEHWSLYPHPHKVFQTPKERGELTMLTTPDQRYVLVKRARYTPQQNVASLNYYDMTNHRRLWHKEKVKVYTDSDSAQENPSKDATDELVYKYTETLSPHGRYVFFTRYFRISNYINCFGENIVRSENRERPQATEHNGCYTIFDLQTRKLLFPNNDCAVSGSYSFNSKGNELLTIPFKHRSQLSFQHVSLDTRQIDPPKVVQPLQAMLFRPRVVGKELVVDVDSHPDFTAEKVPAAHRPSVWAISLEQLTAHRQKGTPKAAGTYLVNSNWTKNMDEDSHSWKDYLYFPYSALLCATKRFAVYHDEGKKVVVRDRRYPKRRYELKWDHEVSTSETFCQVEDNAEMIVESDHGIITSWDVRTGKRLGRTTTSRLNNIHSNCPSDRPTPLTILPSLHLVVEMTETRGLRLLHFPSLQPMFSISLFPYEKKPMVLFQDDEGYVQANDGTHLDDLLVCEIGNIVLPYRVCQERYESKDLVRKALKLDFSYRLPVSN
jgi:hypothetical protein